MCVCRFFVTYCFSKGTKQKKNTFVRPNFVGAPAAILLVSTYTIIVAYYNIICYIVGQSQITECGY